MSNTKSTKRSAKPNAPSNPKPAQTRTLVDRNLAATSPNTEQFEPTEANPVRQHARMGGEA